MLAIRLTFSIAQGSTLRNPPRPPAAVAADSDARGDRCQIAPRWLPRAADPHPRCSSTGQVVDEPTDSNADRDDETDRHYGADNISPSAPPPNPAHRRRAATSPRASPRPPSAPDAETTTPESPCPTHRATSYSTHHAVSWRVTWPLLHGIWHHFRTSVRAPTARLSVKHARAAK